jgi:hypothetical protein
MRPIGSASAQNDGSLRFWRRDRRSRSAIGSGGPETPLAAADDREDSCLLSLVATVLVRNATDLNAAADPCVASPRL